MGGRDALPKFSILDCGSLVMGAAIAAVHVRLALPDPRGVLAWSWGVVLFGWLMVTASGPFLWLSRQIRAETRLLAARVGDCLWGLWGCPWVVAALVEVAPHPRGNGPGQLDPAYVGSLGLGLFLATMVAVPILASWYVLGNSTMFRRTDPADWTQWVGLALTATWPLQCAVGLVVMG